MNFIGTRGGEKATAAEAVVRGIAEGGGLYVPESFPVIGSEEMNSMLGMDYSERVAFVLGKFFEEYPQDALLNAVKEAYGKFEGEDPVPLVKIEEGLYILELFHGPTCAQTDLGVFLLPYLLEEGKKLTGIKNPLYLLTATSGDKGKSVMEAFRDREDIRAAVFYPEDGVSKMQKLQLVTQDGEGICSFGVRGSYDDCQTAVKKMLRRGEKRDKLEEAGYAVSTAGSSNVGVLLPRVAAFFSAYLDLVGSDQIAMGDKVDFSLPAGNLGGALCAYYAVKMGLPLDKIVLGVNRNNELCDLIDKGVYDRKKSLVRTMSSGLDVLQPGNLDRLLFEISGRDEALNLERMKGFSTTGKISLHAEEVKRLRELFYFGSASEEDTVECLYEFFEEFNYPLDTHTAVSMHAARLYRHTLDENAPAYPMIVLASDSPYKLPQAVYYALTGNDVKDSFKGLKRIHLITAMTVPNALKALRYKPARFKTVISPEKVFDEAIGFLK